MHSIINLQKVFINSWLIVDGLWQMGLLLVHGCERS
jgi:hypothetical protein